MTYLSKETESGIEIIDDHDNKTAATITGSTPEFLAMALAAPDLLEALELALEHLIYDGKHPAVIAAKAAIAKARGEI